MFKKIGQNTHRHFIFVSFKPCPKSQIMLKYSALKKGDRMELYFSNKNLWSSYFSILIFISACLFLFIFLFYKYILIVLLIILTVFGIIYLAISISKTHKKVYLNINNNTVFIHSPFGKNREKLPLDQVKNLRKNGSHIIFLCENNKVYKIKLTYLNASDTKKLVNYLKYHPAIKNKKFFI